MRGKVTLKKAGRCHVGITPACAGKSVAAVSFCAFCWDHPRVCGEKESLEILSKMPRGSPPRVRGKDQIALVDCRQQGITPACAGKSSISSTSDSESGDHPRVCGEKVATNMIAAPILGSPPRVRGKVDITEPEYGHLRITPACAGKSLLYYPPIDDSGDHPRVCGEKYNYGMANKQATGSPPRVRGKD